MVYREIMVVCCKNRAERINTRCGQNTGLLCCAWQWMQWPQGFTGL